MQQVLDQPGRLAPQQQTCPAAVCLSRSSLPSVRSIACRNRMLTWSSKAAASALTSTRSSPSIQISTMSSSSCSYSNSSTARTSISSRTTSTINISSSCSSSSSSSREAWAPATSLAWGSRRGLVRCR